MSLEQDLKDWYKDESYPPDGPEIDAKLVDEKDLSNARWGTWFQNVYKRGDEFVAVKDCRPATEMQDWGDYGAPEIYFVRPHTETIIVTKYEKV